MVQEIVLCDRKLHSGVKQRLAVLNWVESGCSLRDYSSLDVWYRGVVRLGRGQSIGTATVVEAAVTRP